MIRYKKHTTHTHVQEKLNEANVNLALHRVSHLLDRRPCWCIGTSSYPALPSKNASSATPAPPAAVAPRKKKHKTCSRVSHARVQEKHNKPKKNTHTQTQTQTHKHKQAHTHRHPKQHTMQRAQEREKNKNNDRQNEAQQKNNKNAKTKLQKKIQTHTIVALSPHRRAAYTRTHTENIKPNSNGQAIAQHNSPLQGW